MYRFIFKFAYTTVLCAAIASAQTDSPNPRPTTPLTIEAAVEWAVSHYPAMRVSLAEVAAAESGIDLAKTAYLPRTDLRLGVNRATRNNVFGLILPNAVIPAISGPVQEESTMTSTFGSSAGVLFSYEPFDFGLRRSNVQIAEALRARAEGRSRRDRIRDILGGRRCLPANCRYRACGRRGRSNGRTHAGLQRRR